MVASGTATVEAASLGMPLVNRLQGRAADVLGPGRAVVRVPFLGMVNLLAEREIAREFLQGTARPAEIIAHGDACELLDEDRSRRADATASRTCRMVVRTARRRAGQRNGRQKRSWRNWGVRKG